MVLTGTDAMLAAAPRGDGQHLGLVVVVVARGGRERGEIVPDHAEAALGIGDRLAAEAADLAAT